MRRPNNPLVDDSNIEELYLDHPFNWAINIAIFRMGDPGVMADDSSPGGSLPEKQLKHNKLIKNFATGVKALKNRLTKAKVRTRFLPHVQSLIQENAISTGHYPYEMLPRIVEPALQVAPPESPLMRRPPTPRPVVPVFVEPSSGGQSYVPVSPTDSEYSPRAGGIPVSPIQRPAANKGPRVADYSAGNPHGPSHQPALFNMEQAPAWVIPPSPSVPMSNSVPQAISKIKPPLCRPPHSPKLQSHLFSRERIPPEQRKPSSRSPGFLLIYDSDVGQPLTEDYIDNGDERHNPDEPPRNSLLFRPDTPTTTRSPTYWNSVELQTASATIPTPPGDPDWPLVLPWECLDDPSIPPEWGGRGGLVNEGLEVSVYNGGNVTHSEDLDREELDKLLHTNDVIAMRLLSIEFDSELLFMSACSIWFHSVTRLKYAIDPDLFFS
ncbi:hypothetical protein BGY98DRAFT_1103939 [Russula aff. rugulosa BPL654]|nr:hypothetical protein BGY98DRAFT_1103939 [Russula aff. rugulosa BPL654]